MSGALHDLVFFVQCSTIYTNTLYSKTVYTLFWRKFAQMKLQLYNLALG